ncbi:hypothetical protein [Streptomyces sp. NBC_00453]|uniref:hypothetical protein n=1 Tax=Streptomyces sp. NBC_00453 TaxID=2903653 RepID=UPI002E228A1A
MVEVRLPDAEELGSGVAHVKLPGGRGAFDFPAVREVLQGEPAVEGVALVVADHGQVAATGEFGGGAGVHGHLEAFGEVLLGADGADVGHRPDGLPDGVHAVEGVVEDDGGPAIAGDIRAGNEPEALGAGELPQRHTGAVGELQGPYDASGAVVVMARSPSERLGLGAGGAVPPPKEGSADGAVTPPFGELPYTGSASHHSRASEGGEISSTGPAAVMTCRGGRSPTRIRTAESYTEECVR